MKPQTGIWMGSLQIRGQNVNLPIEIHLDQVSDDGSVTGRFAFNTRPDDWVGPENGRFKTGNYSEAGTLHFEQENVAKSFYSGQLLVFNGRFEVDVNFDGVIWGPFTVASTKEASSKAQEGYSGILIAAHLDTQELSTARPTAWI